MKLCAFDAYILISIIACFGLLTNLTSINDITNPVEAPARKYSDARGL
jgi:hypothetical protein